MLEDVLEHIRMGGTTAKMISLDPTGELPERWTRFYKLTGHANGRAIEQISGAGRRITIQLSGVQDKYKFVRERQVYVFHERVTCVAREDYDECRGCGVLVSQELRQGAYCSPCVATYAGTPSETADLEIP